MNIYLASGWFTPNQQETYEKVSSTIKKHLKPGVRCYFPKDDTANLQGKLSEPKVRRIIFQANMRELRNSDLVICVTEDKDPGSIFEAGVASSLGKPIVYVNYNLGDGLFNLMLAESGIAAVRNEQDFEEVVRTLTTLSEGGIDEGTLRHIREFYNVHASVE